ncbi:hypothetical protein ADL26_07235 [Thermoactinomyces vulgaris]|jgi:serine-type D-Ala-D-Ala carboxypeptidase (penicillin-binding protein 5/6)|nr:hypothetical protein ADL26_07235 [Thermoactinomyces vulgaris]
MKSMRIARMIALFVLLSISALFFLPIAVSAEELTPDIKAKSYILLDFDSGAVLGEFKADEERAPASMTKMMSAFVVLDKINEGKLKWEDVVTVSQRAANIEEAQVFLKAGQKVTVKELFTAMLVYSANDATVALAEHVGGTEEGFVELMNQKAQALGMVHTHYRCASGLDLHLYPDPPQVPGDHVMSARDSAILARELIRTYPEVLQTTAMTEATFFEGTDHALKKPNWNKMLPGFNQFYEGVDGLKTGHTNRAGYCFTGTAEQSGYRLISVVMGTGSDHARFAETKKLLDYGFGSFQPKEWVAKNGKIRGKETLALPNGVERTVPVVANDKLVIPARIGEEENYTIQVTFKKGVQAPLNKGDVVGEARLLYKNQPVKGVAPIQMVAAAPVEQASEFRLFFRKAGDTIKGWFN